MVVAAPGRGPDSPVLTSSSLAPATWSTYIPGGVFWSLSKPGVPLQCVDGWRAAAAAWRAGPAAVSMSIRCWPGSPRRSAASAHPVRRSSVDSSADTAPRPDRAQVRRRSPPCRAAPRVPWPTWGSRCPWT